MQNALLPLNCWLLWQKGHLKIHYFSHHHNQGFKRSIISRIKQSIIPPIHFGDQPCCLVMNVKLHPCLIQEIFTLSHSYRKRLLVLRIIHRPNGRGYFWFLLDELFTLHSELQFRRSKATCEDIPPPSPCRTSFIHLYSTVQVLNPWWSLTDQTTDQTIYSKCQAVYSINK